MSIGPAVTTIAGRSALAAPISWAGRVLSHPPRSTTPSIGWPRIISSVSIAMRFRKSMLVGRQEDLAERDGRELERQTARLPHAALDGLGDLAEMAVAGVELAPRLGEADDGRARSSVVRPTPRANAPRTNMLNSGSP